jgi:hypothetical protein
MTKSLILIISVLIGLTAQGTAAPLQDRYLETRDGFIRKFANSVPEASSDEQALSELEKQLRLIVGPVDMVGFPKQGKINLETLYQDGGFGQVDGLRFDSECENLFVTTRDLLNSYLRQHNTLPTDLSKLANTEEFYSLVFNWDATVTKFAEVPLRKTKTGSIAYAFLGLWAQDIGLFLPKQLFIFVANEQRVFVVSAETKTSVTQIAECKDVWDEFQKKRSASLSVYRASGLKDKKAFEASRRYEDEGFKAYTYCFNRKAKTEPFFSSISTQAQSLVDHISQQ